MALPTSLSHLFILLLAFLQTTSSLKITACNCSAPITQGILATEPPEYCNEPLTAQTSIITNYSLYIKSPETIEWEAIACTFWIESQEITKFFFGGTDTINHKYDKPVTPDECALAANFPYMCENNKMTKISETTYKFIENPQADSKWLQTNWANSTCCVVQRIHVKQLCANCPLTTPFGEIDTKLYRSNYAYIGGTTIVWTPKNITRKCEYIPVHNGTGLLRSHSYTGRLIDQDFQLEYIFDFSDAQIPCPDLTIPFEEIHRVQGVTDTFVAFNGRPKIRHRRDTREQFDDTESKRQTFIHNTVIRPYISSFHCITNTNSTVVQLTPCIKFNDNETDPTTKTIKSFRARQNFKITHNGDIKEVNAITCLRFSKNTINPILINEQCNQEKWQLTQINPKGYSLYTLEFNSSGLCLTDIYLSLTPCNTTNILQHWIIECEPFNGCKSDKTEASMYELIGRPTAFFSGPLPQTITELDNTPILYHGRITLQENTHYCMNVWRHTTFKLQYCGIHTDRMNATAQDIQKQHFSLLDNGLLRLSDTINICINKTTPTNCVQNKDINSPISRFHYDPDTYQIKNDDQCIEAHIPTKNLKLTQCDPEVEKQRWIFTNQVVAAFSLGIDHTIEPQNDEPSDDPEVAKTGEQTDKEDTEKTKKKPNLLQSRRVGGRIYKGRDFALKTGSDFMEFPSAEKPGESIKFLTREGAETIFHQQRQFLQSRTTEEVNLLANEIRMNYCEIKRVMRGQVISLSLLDGILAAKTMGMKTCDRITTDGELSILQTCQKKEIEIKVKQTKCGIQAIYTDENGVSYSIAKNGYQLVPFTPCLNQHSILNLNGKFYSYRNGEFTEEKPNIHPNSLKLIAYFDILPLFQYDIGSHFEEKQDHFTSERLEVLNYLISTMREANSETLDGLIFQKQTKSNLISAFSWFDYIYYTLIAVGIFILFTIIIKIYNIMNPNPAIRKFFQNCCNNTKPNQNTSPRQLELKPLTKTTNKNGKHDHQVVDTFIGGRAYWNDGCPVIKDRSANKS